MNLRSIVPSRHMRRAWYYGLGARLGLYRQYGPGERDRARRLVFVCKGNICRSPFAEAVARAAGADAVSYGLDARNGLQADFMAIRAAKKFGLSLESHVTQSFSDACIVQGDLIVAMEPSHVNRINRREETVVDHVALLGMWAHIPQPYLFDPYGMTDIDFERCFASIKLATQLMVRDHWGY